MENNIVFCGVCHSRFTSEHELGEQASLRFLCGVCGSMSTPTVHGAAQEPVEEELALGPRVVVGHAVPAAARTIARVLRGRGYAPVVVCSGQKVLEACDHALPAPALAAIVDVGIEDVFAFEVVQQLRKVPATKNVPVVLLASVYEKTRYKRQPSSLHGADAYLELHHVPDRLPSMLQALLAGESAPVTWQQAPSDRATAAPLRQVGEDILTDEGKSLFARRLLSDVALYHGREIADGIAKGQPLAHLADAIANIRELFIRSHNQTDAALFDAELANFATRLIDKADNHHE